LPLLAPSTRSERRSVFDVEPVGRKRVTTCGSGRHSCGSACWYSVSLACSAHPVKRLFFVNLPAGPCPVSFVNFVSKSPFGAFSDHESTKI
jgi:hypothetical protein